MAEIVLLQLDDTCYQVTVLGQPSTVHKVTVQPEYALSLTGGKADTALLIQKSFAFLLVREPNTSILRSFDLSVIAHYFPEYEATIQQMFFNKCFNSLPSD